MFFDNNEGFEKKKFLYIDSTKEIVSKVEEILLSLDFKEVGQPDLNADYKFSLNNYYPHTIQIEPDRLVYNKISLTTRSFLQDNFKSTDEIEVLDKVNKFLKSNGFLKPKSLEKPNKTGTYLFKDKYRKNWGFVQYYNDLNVVYFNGIERYEYIDGLENAEWFGPFTAEDVLDKLK